MASSSKVVFNLTTLQEQAVKSLDYRIEQKERELEYLGTDEMLAEQVAEWRGKQTRKLLDMGLRIKEGNLDDLELSRFRLEEAPKRDTYERARVIQELSRLQIIRSRMLAKAEALVPDEDGSISLTKTQLAEFFDL